MTLPRITHWLPGCCAVLCWLAPGASAAPRLAALFTDHAVLQRGAPVPVWGTASPGERVEVRYRDATAAATADASGRWLVRLPALEPGEPSELTATGEGTATARDVAVGDVWLLSGQSNMEWPLAKDTGASEALAGANLPWLREMKVPRRVADRDEAAANAVWTPADPQTLGKISAVGYYFARRLHAADPVPVGLLNVSYGGTIIEAWMSPDALREAANGATVMKRWEDIVAGHPAAQARFDAAMAAWTAAKRKAEAEGKAYTARPPSRPVGPGHVRQPSGLHHGMIAPVMPTALRGVVWYQGESNVVWPAEYGDLLAAMIRDWRRGFQNPGLPFHIVQLPNYADPKFSWAALRLEQARVAAADPRAHLVVTIDQGDPKDKHPRSKAEVGRRLALSARYHDFGDSRPGAAPRVTKAWREGAAVKLAFADGARLVLREAAPGDVRPSFRLAGPDGRPVPAAASLSDGIVTVRAESVAEPLRVHYLDDNNPAPLLFTEDGLCVGPFVFEPLSSHP